MNYLAFNMTIQSDYPLPLPPNPSDDKPEIFITVGETITPRTLSRTYDGVWYEHGNDCLYLKWDEIGSFFIQEGTKITFSPNQRLAPQDSSALGPLLGAVMAVAMHQRGLVVLHGSSVQVNDKAVIFIGSKGAGKSTMVGYYKDQGHALISDDVCAIDMQRPGGPWIHPSFPIIKLWPDSMQYLNYTPGKHERVHPGFEKRTILIDLGFSNTLTKVAAIITLKSGPTVELEPLTGHQALAAILPHLIINRFAEQQPVILKKIVFSQTSKLVITTPVYQLQRSKEIEQLPSLYELVKKLI